MAAGNIASHLKEASLRLPGQKAILSAKTHGFPEKSFQELYKDVEATASYLKSRESAKEIKPCCSSDRAMN